MGQKEIIATRLSAIKTQLKEETLKEEKFEKNVDRMVNKLIKKANYFKPGYYKLQRNKFANNRKIL